MQSLFFVAVIPPQEGLWWGRPCACKGSQSQVPTDRHCLLRGASDLARRWRQEGKECHGGLKGQREEERRWVLQTLCPSSHQWHSHSQLLTDHLEEEKKRPASNGGYCPPWQTSVHPSWKSISHQTNQKGHGERRLQQSGGMWSLFSYSLWSSFYFVIICVFVPLQLCSYDVLCASVDVKWWKPVHVKLLTFIHTVDFIVLLDITENIHCVCV